MESAFSERHEVRLNSEPESLPLHSIDLLCAVISGKENRVVGRQPAPTHVGADRQPVQSLKIDYRFQLAITHTRTHHPRGKPTFTILVLKIKELAIARPTRVSRIVIAKFLPFLRPHVQQHHVAVLLGQRS